jgi:hypothetical protein
VPRDTLVNVNKTLKLLVSLAVATVCSTGCGSATLVRDGGTDAGGSETGGHGGQGGTAGFAPTGTGGTGGGGGKVGTGGSAGGTGTGGGKVGTGGGAGGTAGTSGTGGKAGAGGTAGAGGGGASGSGGTAAGGTGGTSTGGTAGSAAGSCGSQVGVSCGSTCAPGTYTCSSGTLSCSHTNVPPGSSCGIGQVCDGSGNCKSCSAGGSCGTTCKPGTYDCSSGTQVCNQSNAAPGTTCGSGMVCDGNGGCAACANGASCGSACNPGTFDCSGGSAVCTGQVKKSVGSSCGSNLYCDSSGNCNACTPNAACGTTCAPGIYSCTTGTPVCNPSNASVGTSCGSNLACDGSGNCVAKTADGGSCTNGQLCQNGNCATSGSTGICCPVNYVSCSGSCVNVQSDANNCGGCGSSCQNGLVCSAGQCGCGSSTPNGVFCDLPGQTSGTCWKGACVLPAYFPGCDSASDCVPGGCTGPGGYCLGTVDVAGQVSCSDKTGWYVVCPTSQGCTANKGGRIPPFAVCGDGNGGVGGVTCDGPSDCAAGSDCCNTPSGATCIAQSQTGVIGSGCASLGPGNQLTTLCDPLNPTKNCAAGKSCMTIFGGVLASFDCE